MSSDLTEYFMWVEKDPEHGEGSILADIPHVGLVNLITRKRSIATGPYRQIAEEHRVASGHRTRLIRWTQLEEIEVLK